MPTVKVLDRVPFSVEWTKGVARFRRSVRVRKGWRLKALRYRVVWEADNWGGYVSVSYTLLWDSWMRRDARVILQRLTKLGRDWGEEDGNLAINFTVPGDGDLEVAAEVFSLTGWIGGTIDVWLDYEEEAPTPAPAPAPTPTPTPAPAPTPAPVEQKPSLTLSVPEWMKPLREYAVRASYTDPTPFSGTQCNGMLIRAWLDTVRGTWIDFCARSSGSAEWRVAYNSKIDTGRHGSQLRFLAELYRQPSPGARGGTVLASAEAYSRLDARPDRMEVAFSLQTYPTPETCPPGVPWRAEVARRWELWAYADAHLYPDAYTGAKWRVTVAGRSETLSLSALPEGSPRKRPGASTFIVLSRKAVEGHTAQPISFDVLLELLGDTTVLASWSQNVRLPASGVRIRVRLLQAGRPVSGGLVELRATDGTPIDSKYTDGQGVAEFQVTRYVIWDGQVRFQSYRVQSGAVYRDVTAPESGDVEVTLELPPPPAPPPPPPPPPKRTVVVASHPVGVATTDPPAGTYEVTQGSSFTVRLVSVAPGYAFKHWTVNGQVRTGTSVTVTVDRDYTIVAVCEPYAPPKSRVTVIAQPPLTTVPAPGTYEVDTGSWFRVEARPADQFSHWLIDGTRYTTNPIEVKIERDTTITAVPKAAVPPVKCRVTVAAMEGGTTDPRPGTYEVDMGSLFSVRAIPSTGYRFVKWVVNGTEYGTESITFKVERDLTATAYFERVAPPPPPPPPPGAYRLTVQVVDRVRRTPLAGVLVRVDGYGSYTGSDGRVVFELAAGTYTVSAEARGYLPASRTVELRADASIVLELEPRQNRVTVYVYDADTKQPLEGATVVLDGNSAVTGRDGKAVFQLYTGRYTLSVSRDGYEGVTRGVEVYEDVQLDVLLRPLAYTLTVQVVDAETGAPIPGATVTVDGRTGVTDAAGRVSFKLPSGRYVVSASAAGYAPASTIVDVRADTSVTLPLRSAAPPPTPPPAVPPTVAPPPAVPVWVYAALAVAAGVAAGAVAAAVSKRGERR
ncbi:MAG: carboxypeptidase regulatory-like domain-containing protein [Thermofilaceae archaeon]